MMKAIKNAISKAFETPYENLNAEQFETLRKEGAQVLDVRTAGEVSQGKVPKAQVADIMSGGFKEKVQNLKLDAPILVYCRSGNRSKSACSVLARLGASQVYNLSGGFGAWESFQSRS